MTPRALEATTEGEQAFGSTTFVWKRVKIASPAGGQKKSRPKAGRSYYRALSPWPWRRKPLSLTVTYRGGAECWFEVHARGGNLRTPGTIALVDLVKWLANQDV